MPITAIGWLILLDALRRHCTWTGAEGREEEGRRVRRLCLHVSSVTGGGIEGLVLSARVKFRKGGDDVISPFDNVIFSILVEKDRGRGGRGRGGHCSASLF